MADFYAPRRSLYITPASLRSILGNVGPEQDRLLTWLCERASARIDQFCAPRVFYPHYKASIYDWPGTSFELFLRDDLLSLTALVNGDGTTFSPTTTVGSTTLATYFLYPHDVYPKYKITMNIAVGKVFLFIGTPQQALQVQGIFGYPADEQTGSWYTPSGATVLDNPQAVDATTLTVATGYLEAGQTVYIGTEQELVQSVAAGDVNDSCTVKRAHNGTTAAVHTQGATVNRVEVHPVIERAAYRLAAWYFRQKDMADFSRSFTSTPLFGTLNIPTMIPDDVQGELLPLVRMTN